MALDPTKAPGQNFDLSNFDLQAWPCSGSNDTTVSQPQLATFNDSSFFYTGSDGSMVMWCPDQGGCETSTNTTHLRTELRNLTDWHVTDGQTHIETATCKVLQQPLSGSTIIGQIHGDVSGTGSEALKLRWMVGGNLVAGNKVTEGGTEVYSQFSPAANANLGDTIAYTLQEKNSVVTVTVTINGGSLHTYQYTLDSTWTTIPLYFKAGNYNQDDTDGTTDGALVAFYALNIPSQAAMPIFSPAAGTFTSAQSITVTSLTSGASFAYTTDGSAPAESGGTVTNGTFYSGAISIGSTITLNALAFKSGLTDSAVATAAYTINIGGTVSAPTFSPAAGTYSSAQTVAIASATSGATIRYTTDGSAPTETAGIVYSSAVSVSASTTLKAIAYKSGLTDSAVAAAAYAIQIPAGNGGSSSPAGSGGGGGALDEWFLVALAALGAWRWRQARR
ncbi:MAG TPA: polysaccharide lyase family 7 protein [Opitutaceae bacterium]|nr:polysaccharide lyase family 7 protein [Opitutaceae bacterium]